MRHQNSGRKFDRNTTSRRAMFRNLTANLVLNERIETTDAKAKELRRVAERLITKARRLGEASYTPLEKLSEADRAKRLATKRLIASFLPRWGTRVEKGGETKKVDLVENVLIDLAKRFSERAGGYTRIIKLGPRRGDNAPLVYIELVEGGAVDKGEKTPKKSVKQAEQPAEAEAAAVG
jgi:large subunit ribosomal protein L17